MNSTKERQPTSHQVAKSRWDEASRVTAAYKIVLARRRSRAWAAKGQPGEARAWADVDAAEAQLVEAEAAEVRAASDMAWEERTANQRRMSEGPGRRGR